MTAPRHAFTIQSAGENSMARYFRLNAGPKGGDMVTVRVGRQNAICCLTDVSSPDCVHIRAVRDYLAGERKAVAA